MGKRAISNPGRYYVYLGPGEIKYFNCLSAADNFAFEHQAQVVECDTDEVLKNYMEEY